MMQIAVYLINSISPGRQLVLNQAPHPLPSPRRLTGLWRGNLNVRCHAVEDKLTQTLEIAPVESPALTSIGERVYAE